jgi:hypothetical protein
MKKRLPVLLGIIASVSPVMWISVVKVEQVPDFINAAIDGPAESIGMLLFHSHEAALAVRYPLFLVYSIVFGLLVGFACRFILRKHNHDV